MIVAQCSSCGKSFQAPDHLAGKNVRCKCGGVLSVPLPPTAPLPGPLPTAAPAAGTPNQRRAPGRRSSSIGKKEILAGLSVLFVIMIPILIKIVSSTIKDAKEWTEENHDPEYAIQDIVVQVPKALKIVDVAHNEKLKWSRATWRNGDDWLRVTVHHHDHFRHSTGPQISDGDYHIAHTTADPVYVIPGAEISRDRGAAKTLAMTDVAFTYIPGETLVDSLSTAKHHKLHIAYEDDVRMEIHAASDRNLKSKIFQNAKKVAQSLRIKEADDQVEQLSGPRPSDGAAGPVQPETKVSIPLPQTANPTYSSGLARFVALEGGVYDTATGGDAPGNYPAELDKALVRALSQDGRHLAIARTHENRSLFQIVDLTTGRTTHDLTNSMGGAAVEYMTFASPRQLLFATLKSRQLVSLDNGERVAAFDDQSTSSSTPIAVSRDGRYVVSMSRDQLKVDRLGTEQTVVSISPPDEMDVLGFSICNAIAFSQDASEVTGLFQDNILITWSLQGEKLSHFKLPDIDSTGWRPRLYCLPGKTGWMFDGRYLVDRQTQAVVWQVDLKKSIFFPEYTPLANDHLLVGEKGAYDHGQLVSIKIPWNEIRAAQTSGELPFITRLNTR